MLAKIFARETCKHGCHNKYHVKTQADMKDVVKETLLLARFDQAETNLNGSCFLMVLQNLLASRSRPLAYSIMPTQHGTFKSYGCTHNTRASTEKVHDVATMGAGQWLRSMHL